MGLVTGSGLMPMKWVKTGALRVAAGKCGKLAL